MHKNFKINEQEINNLIHRHIKLTEQQKQNTLMIKKNNRNSLKTSLNQINGVHEFAYL